MVRPSERFEVKADSSGNHSKLGRGIIRILSAGSCQQDRVRLFFTAATQGYARDYNDRRFCGIFRSIYEAGVEDGFSVGVAVLSRCCLFYVPAGYAVELTNSERLLYNAAICKTERKP